MRSDSLLGLAHSILSAGGSWDATSMRTAFLAQNMPRVSSPFIQAARQSALCVGSGHMLICVEGWCGGRDLNPGSRALPALPAHLDVSKFLRFCSAFRLMWRGMGGASLAQLFGAGGEDMSGGEVAGYEVGDG